MDFPHPTLDIYITLIFRWLLKIVAKSEKRWKYVAHFNTTMLTVHWILLTEFILLQLCKTFGLKIASLFFPLVLETPPKKKRLMGTIFPTWVSNWRNKTDFTRNDFCQLFLSRQEWLDWSESLKYLKFFVLFVLAVLFNVLLKPTLWINLSQADKIK